ncbi:MAG: pyridoxal phosphate-dependent aminotransferase [Candidatus Paceibacterota bacterium]
MRRNISEFHTQKLTYKIREVVAVATQIGALGRDIIWENIGDPVKKGESPPDWIKEIVQEAAGRDESYAYSPTKGVLETRQYLAARHNKSSPALLTADNILFFNGLGDAISNLYRHLDPEARVIGPDPSYPSHAAAEASHAAAAPLMYRLDPSTGWQIDLVDLEEKLEENKDIVGILVVSPGNPTGGVLSRASLEGVADLARRYDCFIVSDEIYDGLRFSTAETTRVTDVSEAVPTVVMRGLSKEVPWPGARCGWLEFYNTNTDLEFEGFRKRLVDTKMHEVCATTLPQLVLPKILSDSRWEDHLHERSRAYEKRADELVEALSDLDGVTPVRPDGAYYVSILFEDGVLSDSQSLPIADPEIQAIIQPLVAQATPDERFVYFLLAAEGICVVPLSTGFHSRFQGFRMTLLEPDEAIFKDMCRRIKSAIEAYLGS